MPESLKATIRAAISNAYYDSRNTGGTMEDGADRAATDVMEILAEHFAADSLQEERVLEGAGFIVMPDGTLMKRPSAEALEAHRVPEHVHGNTKRDERRPGDY